MINLMLLLYYVLHVRNDIVDLSTPKTLYRKLEKIFPEMKLRGLVTSSYIRVSVSDLNIQTIDPHILLQQKRRTAYFPAAK